MYLWSVASSIGLTLNIGRLLKGSASLVESLSGEMGLERPYGGPPLTPVKSPVDIACLDFFTDCRTASSKVGGS